jgi:hypothetical protein
VLCCSRHENGSPERFVDGRWPQGSTYSQFEGAAVGIPLVGRISIVAPSNVSVYRLSRPSLQHQIPLPHSDAQHELTISPSASLAFPTADQRDSFTVTPVLTLPESFQSAYVGEEFSCTLSANNELLAEDQTRSVSGVKVIAEMQTPSNPVGIALDFESTDVPEGGFGPGDSIQTIIKLNLSEEGNHVLAVTVTYTETTLAKEGAAAGGRVRTFRKLYQFVAQSLVGVRTKAGDLPLRKDGLHRYALEAQLENLGERTVALEVSGNQYLDRKFTKRSISTGGDSCSQTAFQIYFPQLGSLWLWN